MSDKIRFLGELVPAVYDAGQQSVIGLTGQAGAGKTTNRAEIQSACEERGIPFLEVSLDWFFILSSEDRACWVKEARSDPIEYAYRSNQINWWNFDRAGQVIEDLKAGKQIKLSGVYNRADKGRLTGEVVLQPNTTLGGIILVEGVAVVDLPIDTLVFVLESAPNRFKRICRRDMNRRPLLKEAMERFWLTEKFEGEYFNEERWRKIRLIVDGSNSGATRVLPKLPREKLLSFIPEVRELYDNGY